MQSILTAGVLCFALLFAAVSAVNAKTSPHQMNDSAAPTIVAGE